MGFDRWQDDLARLILAQDANGEFVNKVDGVEVSIPRQVGKTYTVGALVFGLAAVIADGMMIWTAHHTRTSDETFLALQNLANRPGFLSTCRRCAPATESKPWSSRPGLASCSVPVRPGSVVVFPAWI